MTIFKNAKIIFYDKIREGVVVTDGGKIIDICECFDENGGGEIIDCRGLYLSPGFVDIHVHGGGGFSAMSGRPEDILNMCTSHAFYGTTSIAPTTLAAPLKKIHAAMDAISQAKILALREALGFTILGIHLEGPYLSVEMKGAQSENDILTPQDYAPENLLDYSKDIIMMGAAPEIEGGLELGKEIKKRGITASVAHSNADFDTLEKALEHGYSDITHIYSACSTITRKNLLRVAGVVETGLLFDEYSVQFIADLRHLPPALIKLIYKCKGADGAYAITDGLEFAALDMENGSVYTQENGIDVVYDDNVMKLADYSSLAGSVATCSKLVKNMYKESGIPLVDAVKMASTTPAKIAGFSKNKGKIECAYDADIVLFDEDIDIKLVYAGEKIIRNEVRCNG